VHHFTQMAKIQGDQIHNATCDLPNATTYKTTPH